jgi:hypothetical protein
MELTELEWREMKKLNITGKEPTTYFDIGNERLACVEFAASTENINLRFARGNYNN